MHRRNSLLASAVAGAAVLVGASFGPAMAQGSAALVGQVSSAEEGAMEGVVVSAKKDGSTITVSVVTDAQGHPFVTPETSAPLDSFTSNSFASAGVMSWMFTPMKPRTTRPSFTRLSITERAMFDGTAKPIP